MSKHLYQRRRALYVVRITRRLHFSKSSGNYKELQNVWKQKPTKSQSGLLTRGCNVDSQKRWGCLSICFLSQWEITQRNAGLASPEFSQRSKCLQESLRGQGSLRKTWWLKEVSTLSLCWGSLPRLVSSWVICLAPFHGCTPEASSGDSDRPGLKMSRTGYILCRTQHKIKV